LRNYILRIIIFVGVLSGVAFSSGADAADVYGKIMKKKEIRIGVSLHYPPLNFNGGEKGVEMMMARRLGNFFGVKVVLVPLSVSEYVEAIIKGRVDVVIAGFSRNLERGAKIWFSDPYFTVSPGVLVNARILPERSFGDEFEESPVSTIWDLKMLTRLTLAVKKGSAYETLLKENFQEMARVVVSSNEEGIEALEKGKVDGFVHDSLFLQYLYSTNARFHGSYRLLQGGRQKEYLCIGLPFGDTILKNQIDLFVAELARLGLVDDWMNSFGVK
jgi:polar amino acid transport system substrate-binding protein